MKGVTVSSKYQVVIPKEVRESMHLKPGDKLQVIAFENRIEFVRTRPMEQMRGILKGYDATFKRDEDDRI